MGMLRPSTRRSRALFAETEIKVSKEPVPPWLSEGLDINSIYDTFFSRSEVLMNHIQSRDHGLLLELSPLNDNSQGVTLCSQNMEGHARTSAAGGMRSA